MRPARSILLAVAGLLTSALSPAAQTWPARPVRVVVPIAAGSATDLVPRIVFEQVAGQIGQTVVIDNRPGAGSTLGTAAVARAEPDGHTLLVNSSAHAIAPALHPNAGYDATRDFAAVAPLGLSPFVLVVPPDRGFTSVRDLVAAAKAKPGALTFASPGVGTASHLGAERFRLSTGIDAVHVPYKGGPEALTEIVAGRIDFFFVALGAALPLIREGKVAALAVNGAGRAAALPQVPTLGEAGVDGADYPTWFGLFAPAATPREVVERLHREVTDALRVPRVRDRLAGLGVEPLAMTRPDFDAFVRRAIVEDAALVAKTRLKSP